MSVERSELGVLTTKADYSNYVEYVTSTSVSSGQWSIENNTIISRDFYYLLNDQSYAWTRRNAQAFTFVGTTINNDELEFGLITRPYNSSSVYQETSYYSSGTYIPVRSMWENAGSAQPSKAYTIYVRRKDGGVLTPSDMETSTFNMKWLFDYPVTTALPPSWLETTTQSIPTYTTQTTMVTTVDYEAYLSTLTIPVDVRPAIATLDQLINDLWSLHYIPFVVCFALIMGLAIWLLH